MCGIAGFVDVRARPESRALLARMTKAISHRGPDDSGFYTDAHAFLGHRRLSIVDLTTGHQPMTNEDGSAWIIYNGEVFNHTDLRPPLEAAGHHYKSRSDAETVLHAYEQHGPDCVSLFRGMFAFAIWDARGRSLFCARDRLGIKPFYYFFDGRLFVFASEIKALLQHPAITPQLEESQLPEYMAFGYLSGENTLFRGIHKLMPGHFMTLRVTEDRIEQCVQRYWDVPFPTAAEQPDQQPWIRDCRQRLEETVRMRLMSDVPLGMFLSGGIDSSAIAALMQQIITEPVKTFSVGYPESRFSELSHARRVAAHIRSDHHEVTVDMEQFFNALPQLIWHEDEPITWPSSISLYFVSKLASQRVKVVLTGEGADELFGGYARYSYYLLNQRWLPVYKQFPQRFRSWLRDQIADSTLLSSGLRRRLEHTFLSLDEDLTSLLLDNFYCAFSAKEQASLFRFPVVSPYENYLRYWRSSEGTQPLQRLLYADQKTYLVELLMKQDQMSMACSIESRVPLLDHPFVEFAAQVPAHLKLRTRGKYILKKAVEDLLPREIVYQKKMGFPTPLRQWLRDRRAQPLYALLQDPDGLLASYVRNSALEQLIVRHQEGQRDSTDRLWRLLNLQIWGDIFLTGRQSSYADGLLTKTPTAVLL